MKQWRLEHFGSPKKVLSIQEVALPAPSPSHIAIKVKAAGLSLPDLLMIKGEHPIIPAPPLSPGIEVVGEITAGGDGAAPFKVGDRVMTITSFLEGWGGLAEYCIAEAGRAVLVPPGMSDVEAAGFVVSFTNAYVALVRRTLLRKGETLLVLGASGSSGSTAIQRGKALGARVIAVSSSDAKLEFCRTMGAEDVLSYRGSDIAPKVRDLTRGSGVDVVFDPVGGTLGNQATQCIARHRRFGLIGYASGSWVKLNPLDIVLKDYSVVGLLSGFLPPQEFSAVTSVLIDFVKIGKIRTPVTKVLPFSDAPSALSEMEKGELPGKIIIPLQSN
ncbi:NADPH:quinone oxidoreductase family protein [Edaphobacter aggregans]|uniref:NADPH:quinone oxidoreductase family protein n=1 Tax=Edaphobacter aggregans TaxID=570835 RepID=UPI00055101D5|nr:NADPH:quinone oxidoreductase family protein [Edaphobacter aggregans]